ncbi:MAG: DnaD domain protein [Oscillospiraceae bacterium]|jgi:DnaD/phage-associated family protein|nr:DnaD domain protein [Oscillospiraceae bacterium]
MEQITFTVEELDRLLLQNDGDAALLYLYVKRGKEPALGGVRLREAQKKLSGAGLAAPIGAERPSYDAGEIKQGLLTDPGFFAVFNEAERLMGRLLSSSDRQILFSIYRWRGLPPDVMMLLLNHCKEDKPPLTMKRADREAALWEEAGISDQDAAVRYIEQKEASREMFSKVFKNFGIFGRAPSEIEKKYVASWIEMGFSVEAIALAYAKTVDKTQWPAWKYCDTILRRWHEKGWHTPEQAEAYDKKPPPKNNAAAGSYDRTRAALKRVKGE